MVRGFTKKAVLLGIWLAAGNAFCDTSIVPVGSSHLFVPKGFDDNDQVMAVLDGYLPSSCYKLDHVKTTVDQAKKTVRVQQYARVYPGPCLLMLVPYTSEATVGLLPSGEYKVVTNRGNTTRDLSVDHSSNVGPDDYLYVPVEQTHIERQSDGSLKVVLEGRFTSNCMSFKEIKVTYSGSTIEVLPIMDVQDHAGCQAQEIAFRQERTLSALQPGRYLLHVRSLNGHAVNTVFSVYNEGDPIAIGE